MGVWLLKNDGGTLPLAKDAVKSIALVGPTADNGGVLQGNYQGRAPFLATPRAADPLLRCHRYLVGLVVVGVVQAELLLCFRRRFISH